MRPDDPEEEGIWVVGVTRRGPEPVYVIEGPWQQAQDFCRESPRPFWVQGRVERIDP